MKKIFLLLICAVMLSPVMAQDAKTRKKNKKEEKKLRISAIAKQEEEGIVKYKKHIAIGVKLISDGYGGFLELARAQSVKRSLLYQLDISERKHQKEEKQTNPNDIYGQTGPLIYGKLNFFYPVKIGVQQQFLLANKGNKNGVSISGNAGGGLIAGILRPYQVEVDKNGETTFINYDPSDPANTFLTGPYIGGPSLATGWDQLKVRPGAYLKSAVRFDFGKYNEMVNAIEVGLTGEFYLKKIQQMVFNKEHQFFFSAYVSLIFGKRK